MTAFTLRSVVWTETLLSMRGRGLWIAGAVMVVLGLYAATWARQAPWAAWGQFTTVALWMTLLLMFTSGDQITRDRDLRVQSVLLSTPISTGVYVWGKYLAALVVLCALAAVGLLTALVADAVTLWASSPWFLPGPIIFGNNAFGSLGPWPYLAGWFWLILTPLAFGAALVLGAITLLQGQRLLAYGAVLGLWLVPVLAGSVWPDWLDVTAYKLTAAQGLGSFAPAQQVVWQVPIGPAGTKVLARALHLAVAHLPPTLPPVFFVNRLVFLALAGALVLLTTVFISHRRRAA